MFAYLNKYKLLHEAQSGFRKPHSCQTELIKLINDWLKHIDQGNIVGAIFFFYLKKAFDVVVDHEYFCNNLHYLALKARFLIGLNHIYRIDPSASWTDLITSSRQSIKSDVPKDSVLGPLLFLIFINDMTLHLDTNIDLYADDTINHTAGKTTDVLQVSICDSNTPCLYTPMVKCSDILSDKSLGELV